MTKWAELAQFPSTNRFDFFSKYLATHGLDNEFVAIEVEDENLNETILRAEKEYSQIRLGADIGHKVPAKSERVLHITRQIGAGDAIVHDANGWWVQNFFAQALLQILIDKAVHVDSSKAGLVVGEGAELFSGVYVLTKCGFRKIQIVSRDPDYQLIVEALAKRFFSIEFIALQTQDLTQLAGSSTFIINCSTTAADKDLIRDLCYLNYITTNGVVADLASIEKLTALSKEAMDGEYTTILGAEVMTATDCYWANHVFGLSLDYRDCLNTWISQTQLIQT